MIRKLSRLAARGLRLSRLAAQWLHDLGRSTYGRENLQFAGVGGGSEGLADALDENDLTVLRSLALDYLAHRFDILGSGWQVWGSVEPQPVNRSNRRQASALSGSLPRDYLFIDWHRDCRAGYQFSARRWARWIRPGPAPGVDIKVPWELSRMHHLVQLALLAIDTSVEPEFAKRCECEIHNQIRDFIAANPPRFGVNWRVAMDVAIRAANWVLAVSILEVHGRDVTDLRDLLGRSLGDHGRFIITHLEWDPHVRGNHYLADVCGLSFIAAALPADDEADGWLALAVGEVLAEGERQVNVDGSGFEGSTAYHRLSLDMLAYTLALLLGIDAGRWHRVRNCGLPTGLPAGFTPSGSDWRKSLNGSGRLQLPEPLVERLWRASEFTGNVTRPDGRALLIGDNDSGRFVKPCPAVEVTDAEQARCRYPDRRVDRDVDLDSRELGEDHRHLVRAIHALFGDHDDSIDARLIRWLADGVTLQAPGSATPRSVLSGIANAPPVPAVTNCLRLPFGRRLNLERIDRHAYPGWGLYLWKGDGLLLSFRCGPLGLSGTGNHDHNDQLGLTLHLDGRDWIGDPGTYRYTADIAERDAYRSVKAHFAPRLRNSDSEPGALNEGTWRLGDQAQACMEVADRQVLRGRHHGYGDAVHRRVELFEDRLEITDWSDGNLDLLPLTEQFARLDGQGCALVFCPDYGVRCA